MESCYGPVEPTLQDLQALCSKGTCNLNVALATGRDYVEATLPLGPLCGLAPEMQQSVYFQQFSSGSLEKITNAGGTADSQQLDINAIDPEGRRKRKTYRTPSETIFAQAMLKPPALPTKATSPSGLFRGYRPRATYL